MTDPVQAFLKAMSLETVSFPPNSRYHHLQVSQWVRPDGQAVSYVRRRFVPPPENFATLHEHAVAQADRLDNLAAQYIGDAEQYWQICDANGAMRPDALIEEPGTRIRIALPEGIPGA